MTADGSTASKERTLHESVKASYRRWVPILILVLAALGMSITVTANHSSALSPSDEWVYIDYLYKFPDQGVVRQGEVIGQESLDLMACTGVREYGPMGPPCGGPYDEPSLFPYEGLTSAYGYTPLYFAPTWAVAKVVSLVPGVDFLTAARYSGTVWLVLTTVILYFLLREFSVSRTASTAIGLLFIGSPYAWWRYTFITTDAPTVALAAAMLLAAHLYLRGRLSGWWLAALAPIAVLFKTANLMGVGVVVLYLFGHAAFHYFRSRTWPVGADWRAAVRGKGVLAPAVLGAVMVVVSVVAQVLWMLIQRAIAVGPPADQSTAVPLTIGELFRQATTFLPNTIIANVDIIGRELPSYAIPEALVAPLSWLCIAGVLGALFIAKARDTHTPIVIAVAFAVVAFAPGLALALQFVLGYYYPFPARYGAPLLAGMLLLIGLIARNRLASWLMLGYGGTLVLYAIVAAPSLA